MKRLFKLAVLALPLVAFSCSSPVPSQPDDEEDLGTAVSALDEGVIEPFMTTSFDIATRTLAGYDGDLNPYVGVFTDTSRFLRARVENYIPGDPCRDLAAAYNNARVAGGDAVFLAISNYVGCQARVRLSNTGEIRSFTPIADAPPPPPEDPCDDKHGKTHGGHGKGKHCKKKGH
jgi:hypothetical protein